MNKTKELLEVIEGFQNLTAKIKDDNDSIKNLLKNKDLTIAACKKEYRKLYTEHEELKRKYAELESKIEQKSKIEQNENEKMKRKRRNNNNNNNNKKKKKILIDYSSKENNDEYDDDDENNEKSSEEEIEDKDSDFEIVKVKKNKKKKKQKKVKKVKGIIDYINSRNN